MIRHYFDKEEEGIRKKLEALLPGYNVSITSQSRDENIRLIHAGNDRTYGTYYLYNVKENKLTKVADIAPWIKEEEMCAMNPITYTSRDGLSIEGYLTLPKGYTMEMRRTCRLWSIRMEDRGHATPGDTIRKYSSLPAVAMPYCR